MIAVKTARRLKDAGLEWKPALLDTFAIPDRQMDERVFVISDMLVTIDVLQGRQMISFQGASEWALDALVTSDSVWLPSEEQLRLALEAALLTVGRPELRLSSGLDGCRCEISPAGKTLIFQAVTPGEAYAAALLHLLENRASG